jgi:rhodanese-related sulfurtransferase
MVRVLQKFASAQRALFEAYQINADQPGESMGGGYQPGDSLAEVARKCAVDVDEMIEQIKKGQDIAEKFEISIRETSQLMKEGKIALLGVRCEEAFAVASIPGSRLVDELLAQEIVESWPKETPIVLVCHHGVRTADAAEYLQGHGFANVKSLAGGIDARSREIDPSVPRY